ncbi:MAG: dTDP-4-dehydrorhamnose 3,5-epimerase [Alphaproteobacteria bacterium]|nr:dTDP-4-dehydrorhamnose 3,5-epimerase [Alphaproteobacteria bacterium]
MKVTQTELPGVLIVEPTVFGDSRGFFLESYRDRSYAEAGIADRFVQDNVSMSMKGVVRGLHYQFPRGQAKLIQVLTGAVFDVVVDVRSGSPTIGRWLATTLSGENKRQIYVPPGFAHGFCVLFDNTLFHYKVSDYYLPEDEVEIAWNDPDIGIAWPVADPVLSDKDRMAPRLRAIAAHRLPPYDGR